MSGTVTAEHFVGLACRSAIDALMINTTMLQRLQATERSYWNNTTRPSILANDIHRAFNCVQHEKLNDNLRNYGFPKEQANNIRSFNRDRKIFTAFDNKAEEHVHFNSDSRKYLHCPLSCLLSMQAH